VCPEKCRPEDNKNRISLVYGRTIDAWGMVSPRGCSLLSCRAASACALGH
jgi:hypothetical protein